MIDFDVTQPGALEEFITVVAASKVDLKFSINFEFVIVY